uniref:F-box domain-containing protein n=1 Tax=Araucaria cunninghamii TaxID=56994 RepID=A0A0D6QTY2_ARACU
MLDGRGCLLPQILPSCEQLEQQQWYLMSYLIELPKIRSPMGDEGGVEFQPRPRKSRKLLRSRSSHRSRKSVALISQSSSECTDYTSQGERDNGEGSNDSIIPGLDDDNISMNCLARSSRSDYGALAMVNKKLNSLVRDGELYVMRRKMGIVEHWIYFLCDLVGWEAFDHKRQRWMRLPRMPSDECFTYADKESLAVGTQLLVFGRELVGFVIWRYSVLTHSWSRAPPMNQPRCLFGSGSCKEIAIVAGGCDITGVVLRSVELYNSELGTWEALPDMHSPRKLCSGFFMDGKFYVIGGMANNTESLTCGEEFSLETRTWRTIPNMFPGGNGAAHAPPLVAVVNDQLYAVEYSQNEVKKYDKEANTWHVLGRLPVRADSTNGWGLAFKACGNDLIVIGGQRGPEGESIEMNLWHPTADGGPPQWNVLAVKEHAGVFVYNCAVMGC